MGSKSPDGGNEQGPNGHSSNGPASAVVLRPNIKVAPDDDLGGDSDDDADDANNSGEATTALNDTTTAAAATKKKKRKRSKKKTKSATTQSTPPRVPLTDIFRSEAFPTEGLLPAGPQLTHTSPLPDENLRRTTSSELHQATNPLTPEVVNEFRKAGEAHRQIRKYIREVAQPGVDLGWLATEIDTSVRALMGMREGLEKGDGIKAGVAFPTGLAINHIAAHWTPGPNSGWPFPRPQTLLATDVLKVDFGVHSEGYIVDSAFSISHSPIMDPLLEGVRAATNAGIAASGIDAHISDVSAEIQEVMEAHEVDFGGGKIKPVKAVRSITGHNILRYRIHGGKAVPFVRHDDDTKMDEGEVFAIETFGSTGRAVLHDGPGIYGYGLDHSFRRPHLALSSARKVLRTIEAQLGTLVWCRRDLDRLGVERYLLGLNSLVAHGIVNEYPPLCDVEGSFVAQFEHTILLKPEAKEIVSKGDDW